MSPSRLFTALRLYVIVASARVISLEIARVSGFLAVSDDDFSRLVIAQSFAQHPKLDPSGSSWLPLPFWATGSLLAVFGHSLANARMFAAIASILAAVAFAAYLRFLGLNERRVLWISVAISSMPWTMRLGLATVPEMPAATLYAIAMLSLLPNRDEPHAPMARFLGSLAFLAATLCRYDGWPIGVLLVAYAIYDFARARRKTVLFLVASVVSLAGPALWMLWQWAKKGDPFRFVKLVSSYREALNIQLTFAQRFFGYPYAAWEGLREACILLAIGVAFAIYLRVRRLPMAASAPAWHRVLLVAATFVGALIWGDLRNGAPTHHAERALLAPAFVLVTWSLDSVDRTLEQLKNKWSAAVVVALTSLSIAAFGIYTIFSTRHLFDGASRLREVAAGREMAIQCADRKALVDVRDRSDGIDYGFYAIEASFADPDRFVVDRDPDPRKTQHQSSFDTPENLADRLAKTGASCMLAWGEAHSKVANQIHGVRVVAREVDAHDSPWFLLVTATSFAPSASSK